MLQNLSYSGPLWHVAYTEPRAELDVADAIRDDLGFDVFVPREKIFAVRRGFKVEDSRPMLPRYVFVEVDPYKQHWQHVLDVDGVVEMLGAMHGHDVPGYVMPSAWIAAWRKMEEVGEFDRTTKYPNDFKVGETVRISEGPFAGHEALITEFMAKMRSTTARKRAKVLMRFLGSLELPVTSLEKL